jgi:hypothetical protein
MAIPEADKHKEYVCYAEHCLQMAKIATEQGSRIIQREMAAEWLKLADAVPLQAPRSGLYRRPAIFLGTRRATLAFNRGTAARLGRPPVPSKAQPRGGCALSE